MQMTMEGRQDKEADRRRRSSHRGRLSKQRQTTFAGHLPRNADVVVVADVHLLCLTLNHWLNMSEPPPPETMAESAMQQDGQPPESQLSEGILNALRQLQESSLPPAVASTPTPTSTQPNSQDPPRPTSIPAPEPTPPPQSEWDQLRAQLREKPVDADGWQKLVDLAEDAGDIEKIKDTYEGMLETYPNTVRTLVCSSCVNAVV